MEDHGAYGLAFYCIVGMGACMCELLAIAIIIIGYNGGWMASLVLSRCFG